MRSSYVCFEELMMRSYDLMCVVHVCIVVVSGNDFVLSFKAKCRLEE